MTRHMCLVNDTTRHKKTQKTWNLWKIWKNIKKWSCRDSNSWQGKCSTLRPDAIPLCYRAYTIKAGKIKIIYHVMLEVFCVVWCCVVTCRVLLCHVVLCRMVLCHVVCCCVMLIGQSRYDTYFSIKFGKNTIHLQLLRIWNWMAAICEVFLCTVL